MNNSNQSEVTYFQLIDRVGSNGCYQWILYLMAIFTFINNGFVTLNTPLLFQNPKFICQDQNLSYPECQQTICQSLSKQQIYRHPVEQNINSLATEFGPYRCDDNEKLSLYRSLLGFGQFFGIFISVIISDNFGRKKSYLFCITGNNLGLILIWTAQSMEIALLGTIIVGFTNSPMLRIIQSMVSECTEKVLSQKFLSSMLLYQAFSAIVIVIIYEKIGNWRKSIFYSGILVGLAIQIIFYFLVKETPKFILRQEPLKAMQDLNFIAKINSVSESHYYTPEELEELVARESKIKQIKLLTNPTDLVRYPSLRKTSLLFCTLFFFMDMNYYSHNAVIDKVGVNPQFNAIIFGIGDICGIWGVLIIPKYARKCLFFSFFTFASLLSLLAGFIKLPMNCEFCHEGILQAGLISFTRVFVVMIWSTMYIYGTEFYPVSILNNGIGVPTAFGGLGISLSQIVFVTSMEKNINIFFILSGIFISLCLIVFNLPETFTMQQRDQIDEIKQQLEQQNEKAGNEQGESVMRQEKL